MKGQNFGESAEDCSFRCYYSFSMSFCGRSANSSGVLIANELVDSKKKAMKSLFLKSVLGKLMTMWSGVLWTTGYLG